MLLGTISCKTCGKKLASTKARSYRDMCFALQPLLVSCHATVPHCPHTLEFSIAGAPREHELEEADDLLIRCLSPACVKQDLHLLTRAPIELVGALTLMFHTSHEGHGMEIKYGSHVWTSPQKQP